MLHYTLRRLIVAIPMLLLMTVTVFLGVRATTDPMADQRQNPRVTAADISRYRATHGLDRPGHEQYLTWLGNFVRGEWGESLLSGRPVAPQIRRAAANTALLAGAAVAVSLALGIGLGMIAAARRDTLLDHLATGGAFLGLSMPVFWLALLLQLLFGLYLTEWFGLSRPLLPTAGMHTPGAAGFDAVDRLRHMVLPVTVLSVQLVAVYSRYARAGMLDVLDSPYIRTARAKGLRESRVLVRHGMRTALIPVTTQAAVDVGMLMSGIIVIESIFQWDGMGRLFVRALQAGDYAVILPWVTVVVGVVVAVNLAMDLVYGILDPRVRVRHA